MWYNKNYKKGKEEKIRAKKSQEEQVSSLWGLIVLLCLNINLTLNFLPSVSVAIQPNHPFYWFANLPFGDCLVFLRAVPPAVDIKGLTPQSEVWPFRRFFQDLNLKWVIHHHGGSWTSYSPWPSSMRTSVCDLVLQGTFDSYLFSKLGLWAFHLFGVLHSDCATYLEWQVKWNMKRINDLSSDPKQSVI